MHPLSPAVDRSDEGSCDPQFLVSGHNAGWRATMDRTKLRKLQRTLWRIGKGAAGVLGMLHESHEPRRAWLV